MQTSRIRLAISSVQLFVQRCLLNLEPDVSPVGIDAAHWEWMKRYRVWEANRKIFLFPENWLEPEFRDDQTHLFPELEPCSRATSPTSWPRTRSSPTCEGWRRSRGWTSRDLVEEGRPGANSCT